MSTEADEMSQQPTSVQQELSLATTSFVPVDSARLEVLDLFTGVGGLALGFRDEGYQVTGVDNEDLSRAVYELANIGSHVDTDLRTELVARDVPVITGGPPCRPWSIVNTKLRRQAHDDHALLGRFFDHVREIRPTAFLLENVPALRSDGVYAENVRSLTRSGYGVSAQLLCYSDFGAATSRRRLFTVGLRSSAVGATEFFARLQEHHRPAATVRSAISWLRDLGRDSCADHDWSNLATIDKYSDRYRDGRYGWKQLAYDGPAPSFGSIAKTYILHPEAGVNGFPLRVLSVREAMAIVGLPNDVRFPDASNRAKRYQMVANAVTPLVAKACAAVLKQMICAESLQGGSAGAMHREGT